MVGRWWSTRGAQCEVDVFGLRGKRSALVGEARWQAEPLGVADLARLQRKLPYLPEPVDDPRFALWGRAGVTREARRAGALGFALEDMLRKRRASSVLRSSRV
ncbi:MAG TPA: hypothetical protein VGJ84_01125 [Polyangiaceae bacterium]